MRDLPRGSNSRTTIVYYEAGEGIAACSGWQEAAIYRLVILLIRDKRPYLPKRKFCSKLLGQSIIYL